MSNATVDIKLSSIGRGLVKPITKVRQILLNGHRAAGRRRVVERVIVVGIQNR